MQPADHQYLNDYLNSVLRNSRTPGRISLDYKHPVVVDSFHTLSAFAKQQIPPALQRYIHAKKEPRLRITYDTKENKVTDRLVKLKVADLHIFNPACQDCRISINVELNLNRPDIDPQALIAADDAEPSRRKDRMSYRHLAYAIDLTRIDTEGMNPKFELEEECDATLLRQHMQLVREGKKSGFGDIVSGFLDNLVFLMRERAPQR
jgi:polynucleotide 5'-triphosphatase